MLSSLSQRCRQDSEIPKSLAIWDSGASPLRATATTSFRNSVGKGFGHGDQPSGEDASSQARSQPCRGRPVRWSKMREPSGCARAQRRPERTVAAVAEGGEQHGQPELWVDAAVRSLETGASEWARRKAQGAGIRSPSEPRTFSILAIVRGARPMPRGALGGPLVLTRFGSFGPGQRLKGVGRRCRSSSEL